MSAIASHIMVVVFFFLVLSGNLNIPTIAVVVSSVGLIVAVAMVSIILLMVQLLCPLFFEQKSQSATSKEAEVGINYANEAFMEDTEYQTY